MARKSSTHPFSYDNRPPRIACFNRAKTPIGVDLGALIAAMQKFVDDHLAPVWGTPGTLIKSRGFLKGAWAIAFLDSEDDASLEGYHDLTPEGLPMSKVFVRNILKQKDQVSVAASHELAEMLVDPAANLYSTGPKSNRLYDYEVADPVEELFFQVDGIAMTDFVYPHTSRPSTSADRLGSTTWRLLIPLSLYIWAATKATSPAVKRGQPGVRKPRRSASRTRIVAAIAASFAIRRNESCRRAHSEAVDEPRATISRAEAPSAQSRPVTPICLRIITVSVAGFIDLVGAGSNLVFREGVR